MSKWHSHKSKQKGTSAIDILATWSRLEENNPDISTERLLALVADICGCDIDDVVYVLAAQSEDEGGDPDGNGEQKKKPLT